MFNLGGYTLKLLKLRCYRQEEADGDEIFLRYNNERIWPLLSKYMTIGEGEEELEVEIKNIEKDTLVTIEAWDYDIISSNDLLGQFSMLIDEKGGPFTTDLKDVSKPGGAKYSIEWEVV